ncbi:putative quinol monooxygenase [Companilactobacillus kimchiensis]|uniref:ABM domain-containing protein n=1 Tax=Companilactobacillus kimchiensis TaxID=993692 RepID=A0A0R2LA90_9LACO|nr:antibiotic biosynthesis monooxygenase [Companilactobacillus kimchiensis]KRN98432.1 hypothetical protein IV57_GL001165 [Companilactobacillus kimchiensis]
MENIQVIVRLKTTPSQLEDAKELLISLIKPIHANPNNLEFRVMQDTNDLTQFTLLESWSSFEAIKEHSKLDFMVQFAKVKDTIFETSSAEIVNEF